MGHSGLRLLSQIDDNDDDDDHEDDDDDDDDGFFSRLEVSERQRLREIDFVYEYKNKNTRWSNTYSGYLVRSQN